jgi:DHA1 family tetracycline resistance protein-like MFS transporter
MKANSGKTILILSILMALQMTSFVIILPLFPRRFGELGAGVEALGISAMAYALTSALAAPFMGALADRFGRRPLLLGSLAAFTISFCGYLLAPSAVEIILLRACAGAFTAGLFPAVTGLVADLALQDRRAQWISYIHGGAAFGWIAGPIAGGMLYDRWGYTAALWVSIIVAAISFLMALLLVPESRPALAPARADLQGSVNSSRSKNLKHAWLDFRSTLPPALAAFMLLLLIVFAVLFAWAFTEPRFMFYAYNDLGWSSSTLGLMMSTYGVAMLVGELTLGRLSDRWGRKPVITLGLVLFSAQFIGMAFFRDYLLIAAAFLLAGLGNALYDPALSASILDISPAEHRARILGIKSMVGSSGSILGPALVARVNAFLSARSIFLMAVAVVMLTTIVLLVEQARERFSHTAMSPEAGAGTTVSSELLKEGEL